MAAAVQGKKKGFGLDCNRGGTNKTAMKRYPPAAMKRYKDCVFILFVNHTWGLMTEDL